MLLNLLCRMSRRVTLKMILRVHQKPNEDFCFLSAKNQSILDGLSESITIMYLLGLFCYCY